MKCNSQLRQAGTFVLKGPAYHNCMPKYKQPMKNRFEKNNVSNPYKELNMADQLTWVFDAKFWCDNSTGKYCVY